MMPRMFPNGSTTEAVTNPSSPRGVIGRCSFAPIDSSLSRVACTSSTCQYTTAPAGPVAEPKLDISWPRLVVPGVSGRDDPTVELGAFEVRVDAQQLSVPLLRHRQICRPKTDGGESSQHLCSLRRREYLSATVTGRAVSDHSWRKSGDQADGGLGLVMMSAPNFG